MLGFISNRKKKKVEELSMPVTLAKTISKIQLIPNSTNAQLVKEMYEYLKNSGASERHQHNTLKVMF
jgi:hypothetical protein